MTNLVTTCFSETPPVSVAFATVDDYPYVNARVAGKPFHIVRATHLGQDEMGPILLLNAVRRYAPGAQTQAPQIVWRDSESEPEVRVCEQGRFRYAVFEQNGLVVFAALVVPEGSG